MKWFCGWNWHGRFLKNVLAVQLTKQKKKIVYFSTVVKFKKKNGFFIFFFINIIDVRYFVIDDG